MSQIINAKAVTAVKERLQNYYHFYFSLKIDIYVKLFRSTVVISDHNKYK